MNTYTKEKYDLKLLMTYSVSAYRQLGEKYIRDGSWNDGVQLVSNKALMLTHMGIFTDTKAKDTVTITKDDTKIAEDIINYYKKLVLKGFSNQINDFEKEILTLINTNEVPYHKIGIVASLPKSYFRAVKKDKIDLEMRQTANDSDWIGTVGKNIRGDIDVKSCSYIAKIGCHIVNAKINNNIVCFFTQYPATHWGSKCKITGKVKRHQTSKFHGGKETVINYVKKVDNS